MSNLIIILVVILILKAIFSAADVSFAYINKSEINQLVKKNNKKAIKIKKMLDKPNKFFGTLKVSLTLLEFLLGAFVLETCLDTVKEMINSISEEVILAENILTVISIVIITFVFSYFTIILGELLPKKIAKAYPKKVTFATVTIISIFSKVIYPFEKLLDFSLKALMKILNIKDEKVEKLTEKELKMIIAEGKADGLFDEDAKRRLLNTLKFEEYKIKDVLVPRDKVNFLNVDANLDQTIANFKKYKFTRVPIYDGNINNIVGILNIKDFIFYLSEKEKQKFDMDKLLRPAFFISKDDKLEDVFKTMQLNSYNIAIVIGNDSVVEGIITMEDIIEKIVGNIFDEFDNKQILK